MGVAGRVQHRQQQRWAQQEAEQQPQYAEQQPQYEQAPAPAAQPDYTAELE